jgi:hypothetical protein
MTSKRLLALLPLYLLGTTLPLWSADGTREPSPVTTTERVSFAPGGTIRIQGTYGYLNVEGWDRPEVEVTVIKSLQFDYKAQQPGDAAKRLDGIRTVTERKSPTELTISTMIPSRRHHVPLVMPHTTTGGVLIEYEIHVPRDSRLAIHHGVGNVDVNGVTGDIEAHAGRGDIVLWLAPGSYSIDAKTKFGNVSSELEGAALNQYLIGQRFTRAATPPSHQLRLRMGFGGITIKGILPESEAPKVSSAP